ncbi:MAG: hypothetical protein PHV13_04535 [Candidatus ainarchaeum sp.]|nr:hypothetical protein [Candidatus ainarchaeum sp.]
MAGTVDYVRKTLESSYALIKANAQEMFIALLKLNAMQVLVAAVMLIVIAAAAIALVGASLADIVSTGAMPQAFMSNLAVAIFIIVPVFVISILLTSAIKSVGFNIIENIARGKSTDLLGQARKNFWPIVKLEVTMWGIMLLLAAPVLLSALVGGLAVCIFMLLSVIACVLFGFFVQFSTLEVVLSGRRTVDALKASAALVRGSLLGVLLIDVLIVAAAMAVSVVTSAAQAVLRLVLQVFSAGGTAGTAVGFAIYLIGMALVSVAIGAAIQTITLPMTYNFWKGKKG